MRCARATVPLGRLQQRMPSSSRPLGVRRSPYIYMPTIHDGVLDAPFARTSSLPQSPANNVASCVLCWMPVYQTHVAMQLFLMSCALSEIEIVDLQNSGGILGCYTMQILDGSKETGRTTPQCQSVCVCVEFLSLRKLLLLTVLHRRNAGGSGPLKSPLPTKLLLRWEDIQADHLDVPALMSRVKRFLVRANIGSELTEHI